MNKIKSLEKVRRWKEQIYEEEKNLSEEEKRLKREKELTEIMKNPTYKNLKFIHTASK